MIISVGSVRPRPLRSLFAAYLPISTLSSARDGRCRCPSANGPAISGNKAGWCCLGLLARATWPVAVRTRDSGGFRESREQHSCRGIAVFRCVLGFGVFFGGVWCFWGVPRCFKPLCSVERIFRSTNQNAELFYSLNSKAPNNDLN